MARWMLLILLVLNLLVFAWEYRQPEPDTGELQPLAEELPGILLLSESEPASSQSTKVQGDTFPVPWLSSGRVPASASAASAEDTESDNRGLESTGTENIQGASVNVESTVCFRFGPLDRQAQGDALLQAYADRGIQGDLQIQSSTQVDGFWVLIPVVDQQVQSLLQTLEQAGIQDTWSFTEGELAGYVSVGFFAEKKVAQSRQKDMSDKGFSPQVHPRRRQVDRYWVDVSFPPGTTAADPLPQWVYEQHPGLGFPPKSCSEIASAPSIE